ncbi:hypothetical protein NFI96_002325 [Prochilodus magdalenae]|nr:hypothetical protein NFI96_002325 [Prochilodus magdalenae]
MVSECAPSSADGFLTLGCVARDFFPSSISFSWTDGSGVAVTNMVQYPAAETEPNSNKFTAVSHVRIKPENGKTTLTCQVNHLNKTEKTSTVVQGPTPPTVRLGEFGQSIACIIEDFHPDANVNVKWKKDDREVQGKDWIIKGKSSGFNKAVSVLEANQTASSPGTKYTCEVTHGGKTFTNDLTSTAHFSVKVSPPQAKELFIHREAVIECTISGDVKKEDQKNYTGTAKESNSKPLSVTIYKPDKSVSDAEAVSLVCEVSSSDLGDVYIMWQENGGQYMEGDSTTIMGKKGSEQIVFSSLTVSGQKYNDQSELPQQDPGSYVQCTQNTDEEDEFNSLWSTASSFIFLFLFSLVYSTVLSLSKIK